MLETLPRPAKSPDQATARYPDAMRVGDAVTKHLSTYGLGDGGYDDDWVRVKVGYLPVVFPNTRGRKKAIRAHDLHHVAGEFDASWKRGELLVSAWELGTGGPGRFLLGWGIVTGGFLGGLLLRPRETYRAFLRGRRARNMFDATIKPGDYEQTVGQLRARLGAVSEVPRATLADRLALVAWTLTGLAIHLAGLALLVGFLAVVGAWTAERFGWRT
jgi:hypothetical protein